MAEQFTLTKYLERRLRLYLDHNEEKTSMPVLYRGEPFELVAVHRDFVLLRSEDDEYPDALVNLSGLQSLTLPPEVKRA